MTKPIPKSDGYPIIGGLFSLTKNPLQYLIKNVAKHGPVFRIEIFNQKMLVMAGVDVNRFMIEEGREVITSNEFWKDLAEYWKCPHLILTLDGEQHLQERKLYKKYLSRSVVESEQDNITLIVKSCLDDYSKERSVSAKDLTRTLVIRQFSYLLSGDIIKPNAKITKALTIYQKTMFNVLVAKKMPRFALSSLKFTHNEKIVKEFANQLISRGKEKLDKDSFFSAVYHRIQNEPNRTEDELFSTVIMPFFVGIDTLGSSITFLLHEIVCNPALYERVLRDIDAAYEQHEGAIIPVDRLKEIDGLMGLCQETMRKYPVSMANMRHAAKDFEYNGHQIKQGEQIIFFNTAPHFDGAIFKDPDTFDIDRFLEPRNEQKTRYAYSPYGRGPHICVAAAISESVFLTTVAYMLRYYDFRAERPEIKYNMVFAPSPNLPEQFRVKVSVRQLDS